MFDEFMDYFDGKEYLSVDDFLEDVERHSGDLIEEVGRAERWAKSLEPEVLSQLDVTIKGVYPEEDEEG